MVFLSSFMSGTVELSAGANAESRCALIESRVGIRTHARLVKASHKNRGPSKLGREPERKRRPGSICLT